MKTEQLLIRELEKPIFISVFKPQKASNAELLRICNEDDLTRIDFIYRANALFVNGGWAQISPQSFIRPVGSDMKLMLVKAVNIPYAPNKHYFKSHTEILIYTLYFPRIPAGTLTIDIIEEETTDPMYFNFYNISIEAARTKVLEVGS